MTGSVHVVGAFGEEEKNRDWTTNTTFELAIGRRRTVTVTRIDPSDPRYHSIKGWLMTGAPSPDQQDLLWHLLTKATPKELDNEWGKLEELARLKFRVSCCPDRCGGEIRLFSFGQKYEHAIWECTDCHALIYAVDRKTRMKLGTRAPTTAYPRDADERYAAIDEWIRDPELEESERMEILSLWFETSATFEDRWRQLEESSREMFPPPETCSRCQHHEWRFWRCGGGVKRALWKCKQCGEIEEADGWRAVEELLHGIGATDEQLKQIKAAAAKHGLTPAEAASQVIEYNKQEEIVSQLPPPAQCFKCGESDWQLDSISQSAKAAKWRCGFCSRIELVTSVANAEAESPSREQVPREVQREVWRRDQGRCQRCGSQENLEFDHIIAISRGGSNTVRNIQLLCKKCNRLKSDSEPGAV